MLDVVWPDYDCDGVFVVMCKDKIPGSDFDFDDNGCLIETEPEFEISYTLLDGSLKCQSLGEIKQEVNALIQQAIDRDIPIEKMLETLNAS